MKLVIFTMCIKQINTVEFCKITEGVYITLSTQSTES